jgi:hypothetical protein
VRGAEGKAAVRPGSSLDSTWPEVSKNYIRNVEVGGSSPLTSTIRLVGSRRESRFYWAFARSSRVIHKDY